MYLVRGNLFFFSAQEPGGFNGRRMLGRKFSELATILFNSQDDRILFLFSKQPFQKI